MSLPDSSGKLFLSYEGPFSIQVISTLARFLLEKALVSENVRLKLYRVFIELTQNIALYSHSRLAFDDATNVGRGSIFIFNNEETFQCTTINEIAKEHGPILAKNCGDINSSTIPELHAKKRYLRKNTDFSESGAHIGLIMICLNSGNPLEFEIIHDAESGRDFFKITTSISKVYTPIENWQMFG